MIFCKKINKEKNIIAFTKINLIDDTDKASAGACKSCGVEITEHLGMLGTCAKLQKYKKALESIRDLTYPYDDNSPQGFARRILEEQK